VSRLNTGPRAIASCSESAVRARQGLTGHLQLHVPARSARRHAGTDPGQEPRHVGTLEPLWNLFDLTAEGRPVDWVEQFSYD
jgi:predicted dithiol-disulfide oxidoreductase (DUF899 family)